MRRPCAAILTITLAAMVTSFPIQVLGQDQGERGRQSTPAAHSGSQIATISGLSIPEVELVDQHGNKVHFYSDLVKGKIVAINTIFTTCTTVCPLSGANFSELSRLLARENPLKFALVSISIDPQVDTPQRLNEWSRRFGQASPNWILLTGPKVRVDSLLKSLQLFTPDKQEHSAGSLIGGEGGGDWARPPASVGPVRLATLMRARLELRWAVL